MATTLDIIETNRAGVIERAMAFPMDAIVHRYALDEDLPLPVAREHEGELKKFLALCAVNRDVVYGMRGPIDELWHTFVIFTKDYAQFCEHVAGRFIHHVPETGATNDGRTQSGYEQFLADYETVFGDAAPVHLWPRLNASTGELEGCSKCNGCGTGGRCGANCKSCSACTA